MSWLIKKIRSERWKVFQVLEIQNRNCHSIQDLLISQEDFDLFVKRHEFLNPISENNNAMIDFYVMIDPIGRFYQNTGKVYRFSRSILEVGILNALKDIRFNCNKFFERRGIYVW